MSLIAKQSPEFFVLQIPEFLLFSHRADYYMSTPLMEAYYTSVFGP
jgi:hypothetical protein